MRCRGFFTAREGLLTQLRDFLVRALVIALGRTSLVSGERELDSSARIAGVNSVNLEDPLARTESLPRQDLKTEQGASMQFLGLAIEVKFNVLKYRRVAFLLRSLIFV
jgi:hypothetical protein